VVGWEIIAKTKSSLKRRYSQLLERKPRGAFGQPAIFLAGNRMTIVTFEKEVSLKSLSLFSKTIVRQY